MFPHTSPRAASADSGTEPPRLTSPLLALPHLEAARRLASGCPWAALAGPGRRRWGLGWSGQGRRSTARRGGARAGRWGRWGLGWSATGCRSYGSRGGPRRRRWRRARRAPRRGERETGRRRGRRTRGTSWPSGDNAHGTHSRWTVCPRRSSQAQRSAARHQSAKRSGVRSPAPPTLAGRRSAGARGHLGGTQTGPTAHAVQGLGGGAVGPVREEHDGRLAAARAAHEVLGGAQWARAVVVGHALAGGGEGWGLECCAGVGERGRGDGTGRRGVAVVAHARTSRATRTRRR